MDASTWAFFAIVALLAINQLVVRLPRISDYLTRPVLVLDAVVGTGLFVFGLPGFERFPIVSWVVGLLFFLHIAQTVQVMSERRRCDDEV